jgi:uncharacterized protein DUF1998
MNFISSVGKARRSQGVSTFGIGAIVDFTIGSFMPLGLYHMEQQWYSLPREAKSAATFHEPRLQKLLGVKAFRSLPTPGNGQLSDYGDRVMEPWGVPCVRFPSWLECPKCHQLGNIDAPFQLEPSGKVTCLLCKIDVNPVRFVLTCKRGHIDDFPWIQWAHRDTGVACDKPALHLRSRGKSAALGDLYVECHCRMKQGLAGIFRTGEMKKFRCRGKRPWLLSWEQCGGDVITLQRGGSNVHFPVTASMLSIPPASDSIAKILEHEWDWLSFVPNEMLPSILEGFFKQREIIVDPQLAIEWVIRRKGIDTEDESNKEQNARYQEFQSLMEECRPIAIETHRPEFENVPFTPAETHLPWIDLASAVHRLREVRALCGFTRVQPYSLNIEDIPDAVLQKKIAPLSAGMINWRPAIEVRGEGIFLRLNDLRVTEWASNPLVINRAERINRIFLDRCNRDNLEPPYQITPRYLLTHSLAHILIRRMSLDCGYSSASLRERLYVSDGDGNVPSMAGILIYTASSDSDGSLGGIVSLATPERISSLLERAIQDALWCGNDPVCIETEPQINGERLSAAACHNCLLLPETACEKFNRGLDRGMLVGFPSPVNDDTSRGFFSDFPFDHLR